MNRQALRTIFQVFTAVLVIFIVGVIVFTFVQWIRDEPNSYEPINAFALVALSAVLVASGWFANKLRDKEPRPLPPPEPAPPGTPPNNTPLYRQMDQLLGLDDLHDLCFDLSLDYENLAGDTKKARIRSLILEMQRNGRIHDLISELTTIRPNYTWEAPTAVLPQDVRVRQQFLQNVRATWIDGILHQSLASAIALELNLTYQHDATTRKTIYVPGQEVRPVEKPIIEVFEEYGRSLLILGAPGSGKTITLLQLAEELIKEAQADPGEKAPIVLNLSSWAQEQKPLNEWLVEEIFLQYGLSRELGKRWIANNQLLYLLDGLDEVAEDARDACVEAINTFRADAQHAIEMVVCSRITDYEALRNRLSMGTAVTIQPLDDDQIAAYLNRDELELKAVRASLQRDPDLQELTQFPLMLNIMTLAYRGMSKQELRTSFGSVEKRREHLFDTYVEEMFKRRPLASVRYNQHRAQQWLTNLAFGMQTHRLTIFYIERLQLSWLHNIRLWWFSTIVGLVIGFLGGFVLMFTGELVLGLVGGLYFGLLWLVIGLIIGYVSRSNYIKLIEEIEWDSPPRLVFLKAIGKQIFRFLIIGTIFGLASAPLLGLIDGLVLGLAYGLVLGLFFAFAFGIQLLIQSSELSQRFLPNQGIHKSGRNALKIGLIVWLVFVPFFGSIFGLDLGLFIGLAAGLLFGFGNGGEQVISHYTLRWLLARENILPFPQDKYLIAYLDDMRDHILLRRVGGGWVFIHRTLLEHFAAKHPNNIQPSNEA